MPAQAAAPDSNIIVTLTSVRFEGSASVPQEVLDAIAAPYLNREMPLPEVFRLAEEVTAEYRRRGYVLSRAVVGPQRIDNGVLTIQIIEGFVSETRIEGEAGGYRPYLEAYLVPVREGRPTSGDILARALLLAQDLHGARVRAILTPSPDVVGAAELSLMVERRPVEVYAAFDNRGSRWLGPLQFYGGLTFNDLLGAGERVSITGVSAPDQGGELNFISASWDQPVGGSGLRANAFGSYVKTRPGDELRVLGLEGQSTTGGIALQYPVLRSREANVLARAVFTARNSESSNFVLDPVFRDRTRTITGEVLSNWALPWGAAVTTQLSFTRGLDLLGATEASDSAKSRAKGSGEFTRFNVDATWMQVVSGGLHVLIGASAQLTSDSLLASEEFGLGGTQYGRAFDPSEITGDEGFAGKAELFYTYSTPDLGVVEPFVYYEGGRIQQNDPLPGETHRESLESLGGGLRVSVDGRFSASFEYANPIGHDVNALGDRDGRFFVSFSAAY